MYSHERKETDTRTETCNPRYYTKVLTQQLRQLEADGIIHRTVYKEVPPRVEYTISEYGKSLIQIMNEMCECGKDHQVKKSTKQKNP